jgi:hypothetical protein
MADITHAISSLYPTARWQIVDEDYDTLVWYSEDIPKPTLDELMTEVERLEGFNYQQQRAIEYPSIQEQLDDLFHRGAFSKEMTARIQAVKDKYPKS